MAETVRVSIAGMSCNHCVQTLVKGLSQVPGVEKVEVSLHKREATLDVGTRTEELEGRIRSKIEDLGYEVAG